MHRPHVSISLPLPDAEQIRSALACFPGMIFATDPAGVLTLLEGRNFAAGGIGGAALLGESIFEIFRNQPAITHCIERSLHGQSCNATAGLGDLVMQFWCGPYIDARGAIAGMVGTAVDITDRLKTGEAFRQTREMLEAMVNSSPLGLAVLDLEGKVRLWNPAAERKYGWRREEVLGQRMPILPADEPDADYRTMEQILAGGSITDVERITLRRDGSMVPVSLSGAALHGSSGAVTGAMFIAMDLTERKRAEEALQEARIRAEAANHAKSQFLANMSHEIRTPMNAILGMLQLALDTPLTPEQQHYLGVAKGGAESLMGVLNDILDFSEIEARALTLAPVEFDLQALLGDTAEILALQAHAKGLELTCQVSAAVPLSLRGDPQRLRQVLTNLLANAVKFTLQGEVRLVVGVEAEDTESILLRFQITDTGIGVAEENVDNLFDPFVQGDGSNTRKFGGTGLGLAISRQLVGMMGGAIGVESELGMGSTFWFTASLGKGSGDVVRAELPPVAQAKVLVVDDSSTNRTLVASILKSWGARCQMACDGPGALTSLRRAVASGDPFRMVIVDMSLPGMNGEELGRQIAADAELKRPLLLLMTFPGQQFDPQEISAAGFSGHVWKPVLESRLAAAVSDTFSAPRPALVGTAWRDAGSCDRRKRVLVAGVDAAGREPVVGMICGLGCEAEGVGSGAEVITALENGIYDGVLMDCNLQKMDGWECVARIRSWQAGAHNAGIPIIALVAPSGPVDRVACLSAGINDFLSKPVDADDLARVLARWVGAPSTRAASSCVFDSPSLLERSGGSQETAGRMVAQFVEETPRRLVQLKGRIEDCDGLGTRAHARVLRIAAAAVSAASLCSLASAVEVAGINGEFTHAAGLLPEIEEQFHQFTRAAHGSKAS